MKIRWCLLGIVALALGLRVWAVVALLPPEERIPKADAKEYHTLATSLVEGRGYAWPPGGSKHGYYPLPEGPTSSRSPLYPAFLAAVYRVWGVGNYTAARLVQCVIGALLCLVLYQIGLLWGSPPVGLLAALLAAVYPPFIHFSYYGGPGRLLSEYLFMLLMAMAIWQMLRLTRDVRDWKPAAMGGILLGLAMLTRPVPVLFPGVLLVWALCAPRGERWPWARAMGMVCVAFALTIVPWTIRNYLVHRQVVLVSTDSGYGFWVGNNPAARGGRVEMQDLFDPKEFDPGLQLSEADRSRKMTLEGLKFWRDHPERLPKLFLRKILMLWNVYEWRYNLWYGMLLPWVVLGLIVTWRSPVPQINRLLVGLLLYASLTAAIAIGSTRYRYPFEPYLILLAAAGLVWWFRRPQQTWMPSTVLAGVIAVNVVMYQRSDALLQGLRDTFQLLGLR